MRNTMGSERSPRIGVRVLKAFLYLIPIALLSGQASVTTQHNDIGRTGQNMQETILNPANVSSGNFGKLFSLTVDGWVVAQPLYLPGLSIAGGTHNVVFVATEHDSVFAFDADSPGAALWQASLTSTAYGAAPGATTDPGSDTGCDDTGVEHGITGTPVIDPVSGTLYVVSITFEGTYPVQRLHALDVHTGLEKFGGPVTISGSVAGVGSGSSNGEIAFDPKWENQRPGLLLTNGNVYLAWGSHCDFANFHGWVMSYNATTLAQTGVFLTTPNGTDSGIWMGGTGLASDTENGETRLFVPTGNGTFDATIPYTTNQADYGDDLLRLNATSGLSVEDAFTPMDEPTREANDLDLASGGTLILPDQTGPNPHLLVQIGKESKIYLVNRDNLGGYSTTSDNIVEEIDNQDTSAFGAAAYWNGNVYMWTSADVLRQFSLTNGLLSTTPVATGTLQQATGLGSTPSVSSYGPTNGIVWAIDWNVPTEVLYAYNANNVAQTLYSSAANPARDAGSGASPFVVPTIVNGKVYVAGAGAVTVYGLLPVPMIDVSAGTPTVAVPQGASGTDQINVIQLNGFSGSVTLSASGVPAGVTAGFTAASTGAVATFNVTANAVPGIYPIVITATSGAISNATTIDVQVEAVVLTATPSTLVVQQGSSVTSQIGITPAGAGTPTITVAGLPTGVTSSYSNGTLTISATTTAWVGTFPITVTGTYGSVVRTAAVSLAVTRGLSLTNVQIISKATGMCLDVWGVSKAIGTGTGEAACWGGANQIWNLIAAANGSYQFISLNSGLALDIGGPTATYPGLAIQNTPSSSVTQHWQLIKTADGYFNVENAGTGGCLDGSNTSAVQPQTCSGTAAQEWSLAPLSNTTTVNMSASFNVNAISQAGKETVNGGVDGGDDAYPAQIIGNSYSWYGYPFVFGPANAPDAVSSTTVALPAGQYNSLAFLGTAANGSQANQVFTVNYSDGTSTTLTQGINDWYAPSLSQIYAGESVVIAAAYRLTWQGLNQTGPFNLYGWRMTLDSTRTAVSVTLPKNVDVTALAMTLGQ